MTSTQEKAQAIQTKEIVRQAIVDALLKGRSFSLWKTPGINETHLIVCEAPVKVEEFQIESSHKGFAFAPFLPEADKYLFPPESHFSFSQEQEVFYPSILFNDEIKNISENKHLSELLHKAVNPASTAVDNAFVELVNQGVNEIEHGKFEKLVPSRFKDVQSNSTDPLLVFEKLCALHPGALVSLVSSPQTGTWLGASPEILVSVTKDNKFKTIALAGTQPFKPEINLKSVAWTQKEIEEQALVCRYIINCFKKIRLREYEEHGPRTIVAGNVMHLKTDYEVDLVATNFPQLGSVMLKLLHPTSAVCGMPFEPALEFLKRHENYERQFYSGFLGPVQINNESHLYVNLRCMQIFSSHVRLYAGAGITIDSVAEKEYEETEMKMMNLQNLISK